MDTPHPFRRLLVPLVITAGLAVACSGEESESATPPQPSPSDPVIQRVLPAMESLSSYHMTVTPSAPARDPLRTTRFEVDFVAPDTYKVVSSKTEGDVREVCQAYSVAGSSGETCHEILASVTGETVSEAVSNKDDIWFRECSDVLPCSGAWEQRSKPATYDPSVGPPFADVPNWHLEAVAGARDLQPAAGQETGAESSHFKGRFNPIQVFLEAMKDFYGEDSISGGGGCSLSGSIELGSDSSPEFEETCWEDEGSPYKELNEAYELRPVPIDIWLSTADDRIERIIAAVPDPYAQVCLESRAPTCPDSPGEELEIALQLDFSQFNAVEIEIPPKD